MCHPGSDQLVARVGYVLFVLIVSAVVPVAKKKHTHRTHPPLIMFRRLLFQRPSAAVAAAAGRLLHTAGAPLCAGHSKWANIRHIKALKDGQRSLQFIKLARQIRIAVQEGGGSVNPATNGQLRQAIDEATKRDMPNHTIQGVLRKAAATQAVPSKLKRFVIEARVLNKVSFGEMSGDLGAVNSRIRKFERCSCVA